MSPTVVWSNSAHLTLLSWASTSLTGWSWSWWWWWWWKWWWWSLSYCSLKLSEYFFDSLHEGGDNYHDYNTDDHHDNDHHLLLNHHIEVDEYDDYDDLVSTINTIHAYIDNVEHHLQVSEELWRSSWSLSHKQTPPGCWSLCPGFYTQSIMPMMI